MSSHGDLVLASPTSPSVKLSNKIAYCVCCGQTFALVFFGILASTSITLIPEKPICSLMAQCHSVVSDKSDSTVYVERLVSFPAGLLLAL